LNAAQSEKRELFREAGLAAWETYRATCVHVTGDEADEWLAGLEIDDEVRPPECHG
jgi:predicted transcriptional regulator